MEEIKEFIHRYSENSKVVKKVLKDIEQKPSIEPFSTEVRELAYLLSVGAIDYDQYSSLSDNYCDRSSAQNKYTYLFDMAPRTFGQTWGEKHIRTLFPEFVVASKENLWNEYPSFDGEFDLWYEGIRIEVKACRANSTATKGSLASRAYTHSQAKNTGFKYHYQQLKPSCCDVFIWIGVCKDELLYWVLSSEELKETGKLGSQHRNENTGVAGAEVFEGQVFMTEEDLSPFKVEEKDILKAVIKKG